MSKIYLVRHAKAYANLRDFTAFGNEDSPLEPKKGIPQALQLGKVFINECGIVPITYDKPVLSSTYKRSQQTAEVAGFRYIETHSVLNETRFGEKDLGPAETVIKHARERWIPDETRARAERFIDMVRQGELQHQIFFSHGIFIASVRLVLADEAHPPGKEVPDEFHPKRGYIPDLASISPVDI